MQFDHQFVGDDVCNIIFRWNRVDFQLMKTFFCKWCFSFYIILWSFIRVRVANELGAGNGQAAKFAMKVCVVHSTAVGVFFFAIVLIFRGNLSLMFSPSSEVAAAVGDLSFLLASSILLNSVQPVLSGKVLYDSEMSSDYFFYNSMWQG